MVGKTRQERKAAAVLRAQLSLKQAIERIDYAEDVIAPKLMEMREIAKTETIDAIEIEAGDLEDPDQS
jgi:hypothetical protein